MNTIDCSVSTTGFVNYFPSAERTQRKIDEAFQKYGDDIAIIDGEDNWYAPRILHISHLLNKFNIPQIAEFHTGISGIATSGAVIKKSDLQKFIKMFNKSKWNIYREHPTNYGGDVKIYDNENKCWRIFFSLRLKDNFITDQHGRKTKRSEIHNPINNFKVKKKTYMWSY